MFPRRQYSGGGLAESSNAGAAGCAYLYGAASRPRYEDSACPPPSS